MSHLSNDQSVVMTQTDVLPVEDVDFIEIYVGNAKQAAFYYSKLFGFQIIAYRGLETGSRDKVSYVLQQGEVRIMLTGSYEPDSEVAEFVKLHGDSVKDIALRVQNIEQTFASAVERGAIAIREPFLEEDEFGTLKKAVIGTFGETVHTLIERDSYGDNFAPGFRAVEPQQVVEAGLQRFDHFAVNVEDMNRWISYYSNVFGFNMIAEFKPEDISSSRSSLMTKALQNGTERVKFVIIEPAPGKRKSQVQEFLDYNRGAGVQHVAFLTDDIIRAVDTWEQCGTRFLFTPNSYYEMLPGRVGEIDEPVEELNRLNILVDRDDEGYLLQIFAPPLHDRPTMFWELIQRKGARTFGDGNIKALFEAVEREQEKRGNL